MVRVFFFMCFTVMISCNYKSNEIACRGISNGKYSGNAVVFFHKPISGSTYQLFLIPVCKIDTLSQLDELVQNGSMGVGVSISMPSDDKRFVSIHNTSNKVSLRTSDLIGENFKFIYYKLVNINVTINDDGYGEDKRMSKSIKLDSGVDLIIEYTFVSSLKVKSLSISSPFISK